MDEKESAMADWLKSVETRRELNVLKRRFPRWTEYQRVSIALQMEILLALDVYEEAIDINPTILPDDDDDPPEAWQDPDSPNWRK